MKRDYPDHPFVGVGVCVMRPRGEAGFGGGEVLLGQRGQAPGRGIWTLPGGGQELGETIEAAARRELAEETALDVGPLELAAVADVLRRDAAGRVQFHYTIVDFCALWAGGTARSGDDLADLRWVPLAGLDPFAPDAETRRVILRSARLLGLAG